MHLCSVSSFGSKLAVVGIFCPIFKFQALCMHIIVFDFQRFVCVCVWPLYICSLYLLAMLTTWLEKQIRTAEIFFGTVYGPDSQSSDWFTSQKHVYLRQTGAPFSVT